MLTADMVRVKLDGEVISVRPLTPRVMKQALEIVGAYDHVFSHGLGGTRKSIRERINDVEIPAQQHRLASGLYKLIEDPPYLKRGGIPSFSTGG